MFEQSIKVINYLLTNLNIADRLVFVLTLRNTVKQDFRLTTHRKRGYSLLEILSTFDKLLVVLVRKNAVMQGFD